MPKTENIEWEIKDGECKCKLRTKCSIAIERMWKEDKQALGEWVGDALYKKGGEAMVREFGGMPDYRVGEMFKDFPSPSYAMKNIKKMLGRKITEEQLNDTFCEAAIGLSDLIEKIDKEIQD